MPEGGELPQGIEIGNDVVNKNTNKRQEISDKKNSTPNQSSINQQNSEVSQINPQEASAEFSYEMSEKDLEELAAGADLMEESGMFMSDVTDNIRMVSFDSDHFYVMTKGEHRSNEKYTVDTIAKSKRGFITYKIRQGGEIGRIKSDYRSGQALAIFDEVESTAVNAKTYPNPYVDDSKDILMSVKIPPPTPYNEIHKGVYDVLCEMQFHEAGHKQHERLAGWKSGEWNRFFNSDESEQSFLEAIYSSNLVPEEAKEVILKNMPGGLVEMYAMLVGREAKKRYNPALYEQETQWNDWFLKQAQEVGSNQGGLEELDETLSTYHYSSALFLRLLEERFPEYEERKSFIESLIKIEPSQGQQ